MNVSITLMIVGSIMTTVGVVGMNLSKKDCRTTEVYTSNGLLNPIERTIVIERHPNCETSRATYYENGEKVFFTTRNTDAMYKDR